MKLIFRDIGQIQRFKRGADPISAGITAGASLVGNIGSAIIGENSSSSNVSTQLNAQREENQKNRDWQTAEAEKNRQFQQSQFQQSLQQQTSERLAAQQYQSQQWQHQFQEELSHRFDVPQGVNPSVYFSGHGAASGVGGSVSSPTTGAPSSPSGSMPSGVAGLNAVGYQPMNLQVPQLMASLGTMMSGLANAKKAGVETSFLEQSLSAEVRKAIASANMAEIQVVLAKLDQKFQESTLPDRIKKVVADYKQVLTDIGLTGEKILTEKEEQRLKRVTSDLNSVLADYNKSAKQKIDVELQYLPHLIQSQILSNRGSAAAGFGSAEASHESALGMRFERELNEENRAYLGNQIRQEAALAGQKAKLTADQVRLVDELTRKFELENDWYVANQVLDRIQDVVKDIIDIKSIKVKGLPSESESEHSTEVKDSRGNTVYRQHRRSLKSKGKR